MPLSEHSDQKNASINNTRKTYPSNTLLNSSIEIFAYQSYGGNAERKNKFYCK